MIFASIKRAVYYFNNPTIWHCRRLNVDRYKNRSGKFELIGERPFIVRVESAARKFSVDRNFSRSLLASGERERGDTPMASNNLINQSVSDRLKSTNGFAIARMVLFTPFPPSPLAHLPGSHRFAYSNGPGSVPESINGRFGSSLLKTTAPP